MRAPKGTLAGGVTTLVLVLALIVPGSALADPSWITKRVIVPRTSASTLYSLSVMDEARNRLYAVNQGSTIRVIDATTGALQTSIAATVNVSKLLLNPNLNRLVVFGDYRLIFIDILTGTVTFNQSVSYPEGLAVNRSTGRVFYGSYPYLYVLDGTTGATLRRSEIKRSVDHMVADPVTARLFVVGWNPSAVSYELFVLDGELGNIVGSTALSSNGTAIDIDAQSGKVFVATSDRSLATYDALTLTQTRRVQLDAGWSSMLVVAPAINRLFIRVVSQYRMVDPGSLLDLGAIGLEGWGFAVNQGTQKGYISGLDIGIFNAVSGDVQGYFGTGTPQPRGVAVDTQTGIGYVSSWAVDRVYAIDGSTDVVNGSYFAGAGAGVIGPWIDEDARRMYVVNYQFGTVHVLDADTLTRITSIPVGLHPVGAGLDTVRDRLYVSNIDSGTVSVIDTNSATVVGSLGITYPQGVAVDEATGKIYVTSSPSANTYVFDPASLSLIATVRVGAGPLAVKVDPTLGKVFVGNVDSGTVSVISTSTNAVQYTRTVGPRPYSLAVDPVTHDVYVSNNGAVSGTNFISIFNGTDGSNYRSVTVDADPWGIAFSAVTSKLYVSHSSLGTVSVLTKDVAPPVARFGTEDGATLLAAWFLGDQVFGSVSDSVSGVDRVTLNYVSTSGLAATQDAELNCPSTSRLSCTWQASPPLVPGDYWVTAVARDRSGAIDPNPPRIFVHIV